MIDINKIETFLRAAETCNISEAAKQLHVSQPTASHQIKMLEQDLKVTLFVRTSTGLQLTEAGRLLLPWARRLLHDTNDLKDMMNSLQHDIVGELRIACSTTAGKYILPQMAARFSLRYPGIKVKILACGPEHAALKLLDDEAHLSVISSETNDPSLEAQEFFQDKITLIVPSNHAWVERKKIMPDELLDEKMILREATSGTRKVMLTQLAKFDISVDDLNIFLELGNAEAIVHTVAAGYGISFVSSLASACKVSFGKVSEVRMEGLKLERNVYMIRKRICPPHRPRDVFWGFIHDPANADILKQAE